MNPTSRAIRNCSRFVFVRHLFSQNTINSKASVAFSSVAIPEKLKDPAISTLDKEDLLKLKCYVEDWWNPNGGTRCLHAFNKLRIPFVKDGLLQNTPPKNHMPLKGMKILDVGCGGGLVSEALAELGAMVTGVDASIEQIRCAVDHSTNNPELENKPTYYCTTVEEHVESHKNVYDGVVASEIIEHVFNPDLFVKSCVSALKPQGRIFFTTPNRTTFAQFKLIYYMENVIKQLPKGTHQFDKFITPEELKAMLEENGCQVELTKGLDYIIPDNRWKWTESQLFVYAMQAIKLPLDH